MRLLVKGVSVVSGLSEVKKSDPFGWVWFQPLNDALRRARFFRTVPVTVLFNRLSAADRDALIEVSTAGHDISVNIVPVGILRTRGRDDVRQVDDSEVLRGLISVVELVNATPAPSLTALGGTIGNVGDSERFAAGNAVRVSRTATTMDAPTRVAARANLNPASSGIALHLAFHFDLRRLGCCREGDQAEQGERNRATERMNDTVDEFHDVICVFSFFVLLRQFSQTTSRKRPAIGENVELQRRLQHSFGLNGYLEK